jgi:hypothetical protein
LKLIGLTAKKSLPGSDLTEYHSVMEMRYKGHEIRGSAVQNPDTRLWVAWVTVKSPTFRISPLKGRPETFATGEEAEAYGVAVAKQWIDNRDFSSSR